MANKRKRKYQQRLTLFIDFLGFKEHVDRSIEDQKFLERLLAAMDRVGEIAKGDRQFHKSQRITQFSDCIVVSYRVQERSAVFWLLMEIAFCVVDLVERGFLLRGGLTVGDLHHTKKHVVGPAMVRAHELESKVASSPRIIIDPSVLEVAQRAHSPNHSSGVERDHIMSLLTKDADEWLFFDYTSWKSVIESMGGDGDGYGAYLQKIGEIVGKGLIHCDYRVQEKYLWLHGRYIKSIELFRAMPTAHPFWLENEEMCEGIRDLPTFEGEAEAAIQAVAVGRQK